MSAQAADPQRVLVVDDEQLVCWSLAKRLGEAGYEVRTAGTGAEAEALMREFSPEMAILDVRLPDANGMDLLQQFKAEDDDLLALMITAYADVDAAVRALQLGAEDFIGKPFNLETVCHIVDQAFERKQLQREVDFFRHEFRKHHVSDKLVGNSPAMIEVFKLIKACSESDAKTVLVLGESGTGKQLVARAIHEHSKRAEQPFVEVNCAAIPDNLLENELFGHEKGAFTDASQRQKGIFELAEGGTVFLDEIGDMPLAMQTKILKVIENRTYRRLGGQKDVKADVRIIAATNQDLRAMVERGGFRGDLFYRLNVMSVLIPPLRDRKEDIPTIVEYFVERLNEEYGRAVEGVSPNMLRCLLAYPWPGNVRELRNAVERAMMLQKGRVLSSQYLNEEMRCPEEELGGEEVAVPGRPAGGNGARVPVQSSPPAATPCQLAPTGEGLEHISVPPGGISLQEVERQLIELALRRNRGNQTQAARFLRMSRYTLRYRMKKHGLREMASGSEWEAVE